MVGDYMYYLDNERKSDVLVACFHGIGADQTHFEDALRQMPFRAVALSMYGFAESSNFRPPLPLSDHNQLLVFLLEEINQRIPSSTQVLVGHSSGADQVLWIIASEIGETMRPTGVILLGPQTEPGAGLVSGPLSQLTNDPADILKSVREVSAVARDLDAWLWLHDYLVQSFRKFGQDVEGLQGFAQDLIDAYDRDEFFENFRMLTRRVAHVRCVFGRDELDAADHVIRRHITDESLGDRYSEEMIARESVGHIELRRASVVVPHVQDIVRRASEASR
jgi:pimeloyl-ACP methyl ester carboxylesterase